MRYPNRHRLEVCVAVGTGHRNRSEVSQFVQPHLGTLPHFAPEEMEIGQTVDREAREPSIDAMPERPLTRTKREWANIVRGG
jgi:hypothetical protein